MRTGENNYPSSPWPCDALDRTKYALEFHIKRICLSVRMKCNCATPFWDDHHWPYLLYFLLDRPHLLTMGRPDDDDDDDTEWMQNIDKNSNCFCFRRKCIHFHPEYCDYYRWSMRRETFVLSIINEISSTTATVSSGTNKLTKRNSGTVYYKSAIKWRDQDPQKR